MYSICAVLLFSHRPTNIRQGSKLVAAIAAFWCVKVLLKKALMLLPLVGTFLDSFGTIYVYNPLLLLALGWCIRDLRKVTRLVSGVVFSAMFILCMGYVPNLLVSVFDMTMAEVAKAPLNNLLTLLIIK